MTELAVETQELTRTFGDLRAVDSVSLRVPRGTIFGFLGPNGAGKTTMIRLLLGLLEPTSGQARVLGFDVRTQADQVRQRTGALLEHSGIYERLSAEDNLEFYGRVWHIPPGERRARIKDLLTHLGLWERRAEAPSKWSRGMKQKLAVARALLHRPDLIFLDEPTAGLDPVAAAALRDDLAGLAASEGATVFLTTHNLAEAEKLCGLIGVIRQGRLLAVDSPAGLRAQGSQPRLEIVGRGLGPGVLSLLRQRPEVRSAEIEDSRLMIELNGDTAAAPLVSLLVAAGVEVEEVNKQKESLESVFLTLMREDEEGSDA
jgi:ABC-2 type transport system ATP-binding protein